MMQTLRSAAALAWVLLTLLAAAGAAAAPYRLGPEDTVSLRVVAWNDESASYQSMEALAGNYTVAPDGSLAIPIAGSIAAGGATAEDLAAEIAARLQAAAGLYQPPAVSMQILAYRPFYVSGDAAAPGAYAWRPGLTASKALALAGGLYRSRSQLPGEGTEYRLVNSLRGTQVELVRMRARQARLMAEQAGAERIAFPQDLRHPDGPEAVARILTEETAIFDIRGESQVRTIESNEALIALYHTELEALNGKLEGQRRQVEIARDQADKLRGLVDRGAVVASRLVDAERILANLNAEELDLNTAIFRARQRIGETRRDLLQAVDNRRHEVVAQLQDTRRKIELETKREAMFLGLAASQGSALGDLPLSVTMKVRRSTADGVEVITVGPDDAIRPGDVFEVSLDFTLTTQ
ncbi:polysaccharide biosynthesis/export family protein [Leisingera sp. NJS204]|uniref:polysaccharide biosynthesis/export family protein n=1 Tax=Leisingera sp. NJS204 TaxID=2508307 RepID=UPI0013E96960|nr:polysaccharide biosynthesis/export family protein [Leisingera sp. NJS204]